MNNKAQFYLVAALVVISLISGVVAIYNKASTTQRETLFYSLSEEIKYETAQIINHGLYYSLSEAEIVSNIEGITDYYSAEHPNVDILVVFGDSANLNFILYRNIPLDDMNIYYGSNLVFLKSNQRGKFTNTNARVPGNNVRVSLSNGASKDFILRDNENYFVFVLREEAEGELYLAPKLTPLEKILGKIKN